ncbi:MAG TPA: hypothetical protein VGC54_06435 [Planctomycetota bacterium]
MATASTDLPPDLAELEAGIYRSTLDNGLLDLCAGAGVLVFGLGAHFDWGGLVPVWIAVIFGARIPIQRRLLASRIGHVRPLAPRRRAEHNKKLLVGGALVFTMLVGIAAFLLSSKGGEFLAGIDFPLLVVAAGVLPTIFGAVLFTRFLRTHPVLDAGL